MPEPLEHRYERFAVPGVGGCRQGAEGPPVVGAVSCHHPRAAGRDSRVLDRGFDRFRARVGEGDSIERWRQQRCQRIEEFLPRRGPEALVGIRELRRLPGNRLGHHRMTVSQQIDTVIRH